MSILLPILFVLATYGYCTLAVDALKLKGSHALPMVFVFEALFLFAAGFAGLLYAASLLLLVAGTGVLIYYFIQKERRKLLWFDPVWMGLFLLLSAFAVYHLYGQKLTHYDNFSHWANVVQVMLDSGRFPVKGDLLISFTSYPPGSASFLYLFGTVFGNREDMLLIGQAILLISMILALYQKNARTRFVLPVVLAAFGVFSFFYNSTIYDLLVDSLLPCVGGFAILLLYTYLDQPKKIWLTVIPVLTLAFFVKNSGIYFAVIALILYSASLHKRFGARRIGKKQIVWMAAALVVLTALFCAAALYFARGQGYSVSEVLALLGGKLPLLAAVPLVIAGCLVGFDLLFLMPRAPKRERITLIALVAVPAILFALWMLHVRLVFHGTASKHAMSISNYIPMLMHKSLSDMITIAKSFVKALLALPHLFWCGLFTAGGVLSYVFTKRLKPETSSVLRTVLFSFLGYLLFLYVMYIVSMPKAEAYNVSEFDRYFKSVVLFCLYLLLYLGTRVTAAEELPAQKSKAGSLVTYGIAALVAIGLIASVGSKSVVRQDYTASERYYLETLIQDYQIESKESYLFVLAGENDYYMQYLGLYTFRSNKIATITKEEIADFSDWGEYRYVICMHLSNDDKARVLEMLGEAPTEQPLPDVFVQN
jgi:hypothetical protein